MLTSPPPLPNGKASIPKDARLALIIIYGLIGAPLVAWPIAAFTSFFILDAPIESAGDSARRYGALAAIWLYPVLFGFSAWLSIASARKRKSLAAILGPAMLPITSPVYLFLFF